MHIFQHQFDGLGFAHKPPNPLVCATKLHHELLFSSFCSRSVSSSDPLTVLEPPNTEPLVALDGQAEPCMVAISEEVHEHQY